MGADAFVNLIADEPRESPRQTAVRLLAGDGAAALGVDAGGGLRPLGGALHRRHPDGVFLTARAAPDLVTGDVAAVLAVDEFAPVCGVKAHTAGLVARGTLRPLPPGGAKPSAAPSVGHPAAAADRRGEGDEGDDGDAWDGSAGYLFVPRTIEVRSTHGTTSLTAADLDGVSVDEVAARRVDVVEDVLTVCGRRLCEIGAAALARAGAPLLCRSVCPLAVDSWGATLLCVTDAGHRQVRATFDRPVSTPHEVVLAMAAYGRAA